jgi:phospholipase C
MTARAVLLAWTAASLCGCAGARTAESLPRTPLDPQSQAVRTNTARASGLQLIQHVVIVMQENRSFDNLFQGFPGANSAASGQNSKGETIPLQPVTLEAPWNVDHNAEAFFAACDGKPRGRNCQMDGFNKERTVGKKRPKSLAYSYVPQSETRPYFDIGKQFVVGDAMFPSNIDESFESHQYIIAAQANRAVDQPNGTEGCQLPAGNVLTLLDNRRFGPTEQPCFESQTLGDELDAKHLPWRYYASATGDLGFLWSAYQAIGHIYNGPDWKNDIVNPPSAFLKQIARGKLETVTWITPTCATSDHADCLSNQGPDWVASVVNTVGESKFWDSTAIFVMWDEWGGWYDHVPPPYKDFDGLGVRVPLLIVSPYAKKGYVSHVQYETSSILRFIEDDFGLPSLAASDARATSPAADCFDFSKPPRPFKPIHTKMTARDFIDAAPDPRPIDTE